MLGIIGITVKDAQYFFYDIMFYNIDMTDEDLLKITSSIEEKLGAESSAVIADDIGLLMTGNAEAQKALQNKDAEIKSLKERNEKLVLANGNLLKQVPAESKLDPKQSPKVANKSNESQPINLSDAFDKSGRFIH